MRTCWRILKCGRRHKARRGQSWLDHSTCAMRSLIMFCRRTRPHRFLNRFQGTVENWYNWAISKIPPRCQKHHPGTRCGWRLMVLTAHCRGKNEPCMEVRQFSYKWKSLVTGTKLIRAFRQTQTRLRTVDWRHISNSSRVMTLDNSSVHTVSLRGVKTAKRSLHFVFAERSDVQTHNFQRSCHFRTVLNIL